MSSSDSRQSKVYRGEALRAVAMPLGGIGTGTIAICGDGSLRQWQTHNQVNHLACVPHSFFAIWARRFRPVQPPIARVLQSSALYDAPVPSIPTTSNDHVVPQAHRSLLKRLPGVQSTEFIGEYPIAELTYYDPELPVQVTMEAFSPFVPLNSKDSALPGIVFNLQVTNPNDWSVLVSVAASLQNAVGWDGVTPIFGTRYSGYGGNFNSLERVGNLTSIGMGTARLPQDDDGYGSMALVCLSPDATFQTQWDDLDTFWADFSSDGRLNNVADTTPSAAGHTWNGVMAVPFSLAAGESRTITFIVTWYFPNRYVNYSQKTFFGIEDEKTRFWIGNQYSNWFRSAFDVASYLANNLERLTEQTRLTRNTFYDTSLPYSLIDAVTSQISVMRSPSCFWAHDGRFYGFEGCNGASTSHSEPVGGCCPLNCTHVWNYEMALARLFPSLERTMRETEWETQQHPTGYLPHRVALPLYLPRPWDRKIGGPDNPALDGLLGGILKTYREYRACGDADWLARMWHHLKQALDYIWTTHDPEQNGVIEGEQPNTYDISIYGANTFIGTLYLAALRAMEIMARLQGEEGLAIQCQNVFQRGRAALEGRLWNGEYYIQDVDLQKHPKYNWGIGCHADQLFGQWWAHILGLGDLLEPDRVRAAVASIFRYNFLESFAGYKQQPRQFVADDDQGLVNCTWPHGGRPTSPTLYSDEVWTGIEYEIAALLFYAGEATAALRIVEAAHARHDGRKQNPWNDVECGDYYVRAMASWALLESASGYYYDASVAEIGFAPNLTPHDFRAPFVARDGWGTFSHQVKDGTQVEMISVVYGSLEIRALRFLPRIAANQVTLQVDESPIPASLSRQDDWVIVRAAQTLTIRMGQSLTVRMEKEIPNANNQASTGTSSIHASFG